MVFSIINLRLLRYIICIIVMGVLYPSCNVTRHVPTGSYLLQRAIIDADQDALPDERISSVDFEKYTRQAPNKRFLGINFYVWMYNLANPKKDNGWNNFKRRVGEEPVLLNMLQTDQTVENFKIYMNSKGFYSSSAIFKIDTTSRDKRAFVTYKVKQGVPYRIDSISYDFKDKTLEKIILSDTTNSLIHRGNIFDISVLDRERMRVAAHLKDNGYYKFSINNIEYIADTLSSDNLVAVDVVVKKHIEGYDGRGQVVLDDNSKYRIKKVNIFTNYDAIKARTDVFFTARLDTIAYKGLNLVYEDLLNIRPAVIRRAIPMNPDTLYNARLVEQTYSSLMSLGYFKSAKISFDDILNDGKPNFVAYATASDSAKMNITTPIRERDLECNILCTPALRQSFKVELEGSTTSSFYGLKTTIGYQNRNIFKGAESFDIDFTTGYEHMRAKEATKRQATEFGVATRLLIPRFLLPFKVPDWKRLNLPKTEIAVSINFQDRPFYTRTLSSLSLSYQWSNKKYSSFSLSPININVVDMGYLDKTFENDLIETGNDYLLKSYSTQFIAGLSFGYVYNNQQKSFGRNATVVRLNVETAGNLIDVLAPLFAGSLDKDTEECENFYTVFGIKYAQYFRSDLSLSHNITLGDRVTLAGRLYGGIAIAYGNSTSIPVDRMFYAGGSNGMRGWAPRTLGPGSSPFEKSDTYEYHSQLGDMKLEANLELRFPIWDMIHGATFFDLGNIWFIKSEKGDENFKNSVFHFDKFYKQLGLNTGVGLRLDIKFAVLRLDWGIQLHNPNEPVGERWIHGFEWKNTALNFGVGYPF